MQIILLCGGSGTRLWPLSNNTRSKQFLKLFKTPDGAKESMFQRVLRQISESGLEATINIATSQSQVDSVIAQGGNDISIIEEPCRRDTFPAIALAVTYLSKEKRVNRDEVVVVMPCDPYTETGYYDTIREMGKAVKSDFADLILMGINPTQPSSKFGYIMPSVSQPGKVDYFIEKPHAEKAALLISDGALWNGGVFAFKLGYLLDIVAKYSNHGSFEAFRADYETLPKISFDYEVVEKTESIGVVKYSGKWSDLGTWRALCDELQNPVAGKVISKNNDSTTILNELSLPIISCGCKNLIIAASPDGILVADKDCAESIKESVKEVSLRPMYEERRWGHYRVLESIKFPDGTSVLTKTIVLTPGSSISYHRHTNREEIWTIAEGTGEVVKENERIAVKPGDTIILPQGTFHALRASSELTLIEIQRGTHLVEEDVERLKFEW